MTFFQAPTSLSQQDKPATTQILLSAYEKHDGFFCLRDIYILLSRQKVGWVPNVFKLKKKMQNSRLLLKYCLDPKASPTWTLDKMIRHLLPNYSLDL